jgi:hypothetical protein
LKNWQAALADLDSAIKVHEWDFNQKQPCVCHRVASLLLTKATVLEKMGREKEAEEVRKRAAAAKFNHSASRYSRLHDRIEASHGKEAK